jgi:hypothetical protein
VRTRVVAAVAVAAALGLPTAAGAAVPFKATIHTPSSQPQINKDWTVTVTARTAAGAPLRATATYQFLFQGQVVSTQFPWPGHPNGGKKPWAFRDHFTDRMRFPARSRGIPLTLRVVVKVAGKGTVNLNKQVRVRR